VSCRTAAHARLIGATWPSQSRGRDAGLAGSGERPIIAGRPGSRTDGPGPGRRTKAAQPRLDRGRPVMKTLPLSKASEPLSEYARSVADEPLLLTVRGKPFAALVDVQHGDRERIALATHPRFIAIIERSRASLREKGGIPEAEVRRHLGIPAAPRRRPARHKGKGLRRMTGKSGSRRRSRAT